jgi:hypothetical protein
MYATQRRISKQGQIVTNDFQLCLHIALNTSPAKQSSFATLWTVKTGSKDSSSSDKTEESLEIKD